MFSLADDTLMYDPNCCGRQFCKLSLDMVKIESWAQKWNTMFNRSKSTQLYICRRRSGSRHLHPLLLNMCPIPGAEKTKHLGIVVDSNLRWSDHVQNLIQRSNYKVYILRRLAYRCGRGSSASFVNKLDLQVSVATHIEVRQCCVGQQP